MNVVALTGRVIDDPVRKDTTKGVVAEWVLAVDGKQREWITVEVWGRLAGTCAAHLVAGRRISVSGALHTKKWNDASGARQERWYVKVSDVTFLDQPPNKATCPAAPEQAVR